MDKKSWEERSGGTVNWQKIQTTYLVGPYWLSTGTHKRNLLHFVALSGVASLFVIGVDNRKVGVDNRKKGGRQQKSSRADKRNNFLIIWSVWVRLLLWASFRFGPKLPNYPNCPRIAPIAQIFQIAKIAQTAQTGRRFKPKVSLNQKSGSKKSPKNATKHPVP